jgi:hypothetical protein
MEELFQSGSIDQKRSSVNWPLAKILKRYINHVTRRLGLSGFDCVESHDPNVRRVAVSITVVTRAELCFPVPHASASSCPTPPLQPRRLRATHRHPRTAPVATAHLVGPSCDPPLMPCSMMNTGASRGRSAALGMLRAATRGGAGSRGAWLAPSPVGRVAVSERIPEDAPVAPFREGVAVAIAVAVPVSILVISSAAACSVWCHRPRRPGGAAGTGAGRAKRACTNQSSPICPPSAHGTSCRSYLRKMVNIRAYRRAGARAHAIVGIKV